MNTRELGTYGEEIAVKYLQAQGYTILERNFHAHRSAEIDIIGKDGKYYAFIEVKTRMNFDTGLGREAVTKAKQRNIRYAALYYLTTHRLNDVPCRFDVIEIIFSGDTLEGLDLIKDAF